MESCKDSLTILNTLGYCRKHSPTQRRNHATQQFLLVAFISSICIIELDLDSNYKDSQIEEYLLQL
ncbi:hypothetical protein ACE6H2_015622 [Prunus campanulata]